MTSSRVKKLVVQATLFTGLLAGLTANRALVEIPAWGRIGVILWTDFARVENAGMGFILYPGVGAAALLFTIAAAVAFRFDRSAFGSRGLPIYAAALLAIVSAIVTRVVLVPAMFSLGKDGINPAELQSIFLTVARWSGVNDALHVLTFGLNLWALTEVYSSDQGRLRAAAPPPLVGLVENNISE